MWEFQVQNWTQRHNFRWIKFYIAVILGFYMFEICCCFETFHLIQFFHISLNVWIVNNSFEITLKKQREMSKKVIEFEKKYAYTYN